MDLSNYINEKYIRGYTPWELGIDGDRFPLLKYVFFDQCGSQDVFHNDSPVDAYHAHTHMCPFDPILNSICMLREYLRNSDGTLSDIFYHEYGHVLSQQMVKKKDYIHHVSVGQTHLFTGVKKPFNWDQVSHGDEWLAAMGKLDKPHLNTINCNAPY